MKSFVPLSLSFLLVLALAPAVVGQDGAPSSSTTAELSVDDLVAKSIEARGGRDAWKAIEAVRLEGTASFGEDDATFTVVFKRPGRMKMTVDTGSGLMVQAYDGTTAWQTMPMMGKTQVQVLEDGQRDAVVRQADFEGPLIDWRDKGHTVTYAGPGEVEGVPAHRLEVDLGGGVSTIYLDAESFRELQVIGEAETPLGAVKTTVRYDDYREVGGILLAHEITYSTEGSPITQTVRFQSIEALDAAEVADDTFAAPTGAGG
ncbi:MAG: hypothetical protein AAGC60_18975 [Acidobacteriota bacterium]